MKNGLAASVLCTAAVLLAGCAASGHSGLGARNVYDLGRLKPTDSELEVKAGQLAPDFTLPSVSGKRIRLSQYRGNKNVALSFVSAAFSVICSVQWPGYNIVKDAYDEGDVILLGITVHNIPTLYAWHPLRTDAGPDGSVQLQRGDLKVQERADAA